MRAAALALATLLGWTGCSFDQPLPERRLYHLAAPRHSEPHAPCAAALEMRRVRVAPPFERNSLVVQREDKSFVSLPFDQFESPPGMEFRAVVLSWLRSARLFEAVFEPGEGRSDWVLEAEIEWLFASGPSSHLSVRFAMSERQSARTDRLLRYVEVHPAPRPDPRGFVEGWNAAAAAVLTRLESDLRVFLEEQGRCDAPAKDDEAATRS